MMTLILVVLIGQCGPAGCPRPARAMMPALTIQMTSSIQAEPIGHPRQWVEGVDRRTGKAGTYWGWIGDDGRARFNRGEQPTSTVNRSTPKPETEPEAERQPTANVERPPAIGNLPAFAVNGVNREKLDRVPPDSYSHAGEAGRRFIEQVRTATVEDDSGKRFITVIGTEADCAPVMAALHGALKETAKGYHLREFRPTDPYVTGVGLPGTGHPSIIVQDARAVDGTAGTLHRQDNFFGGAAALGAALDRVGAIRKPNPNFQPDKTPDHRTPEGEAGFPRWLVMAGVGVAVLIVTPKRKK